MEDSARNMGLKRRDFLRAGTLLAAGGFLGWTKPTAAYTAARETAQQRFSLTLADLPYAFDALEPSIDARTMQIHHGRHHAAYTNNTVAAVNEHPELLGHTLEQLIADISALPRAIQTTIRNNGGGHWNHDLFWEIMSPRGGGEPSGKLADAIAEEWGDFESFKAAFKQAGMTRFGSGWAWLITDGAGRLKITSTPNQDNPLMRHIVDELGTPILGLDVWEHAYYLHYQNRRGDYIDAWWDVVHWDHVDSLYRLAIYD